MLKRVLSPLNEFGWAAGCLYLTHRALQTVSSDLALQVYELMVQPIPEKPLLPGRLGQSIEIREIPRGAPEIDRMPARSDVKRTRFEQGAICLGAYQKGELIGYLWLCHDQYEEDEVRCTYVLAPPDETVFDFDLYIFPEHRMGLGFVGIWNGVNEYLHNRRIRFTFSRLTRFNLASRRAHAHLGWKLVARVVVLQAWGLELMFVTIRPFLHFSWNRRDRVRLNLKPHALAAGRDGATAAQQ